MKARQGRRSEAFWPSLVMKKWLNIKPPVHDFSEDDFDTETESEDEVSSVKDAGLLTDEDRPCRTRGKQSQLATQTSDYHSRSYVPRHRRGISETLRVQYINTKDVRVTVGTWNVAGRAPDVNLEIEEWLCMKEPADIYVLGFQEVVPLNAGNVLGTEDSRPIPIWEAIIRRTLNRTSVPESNYKSYSYPPSPMMRSASTNDLPEKAETPTREFITEDRRSVMRMYGIDIDSRLDWPNNLIDTPQVLPSDMKSDQQERTEPLEDDSFFFDSPEGSSGGEDVRDNKTRPKYVRIASKQMVGIYVSVWVRRKLRRHINNLKVSPVGVGIMGYMGNKGSVSVSMSLYQSRMCFVCSHLTSGHKDGDQERRNADVCEIMRRTRFTSVLAATDQPLTIPSHDQIFWLGDLNYRLNMPDEEIRKLLGSKKLDELISSDQLMEELGKGHVFDGWKEGPIDFPPTYKYEINSDRYVGENPKEGEKKRSPAWCDRILWSGTGIKQHFYRRADIRMSDHRPVSSMFSLEIEAVDCRKLHRVLNYNNAAVRPAQVFPDVDGDL